MNYYRTFDVLHTIEVRVKTRAASQKLFSSLNKYTQISLVNAGIFIYT